MAPWAATAVEGDIPSVLLGRIAHAEIDLYVGDGAAAYRRIDQDWHRRIASPLARLAFVRARMLGLHGVAALAACRSGELDRRLVRAAVRDARSLRAMRMPWTCALARILEAGSTASRTLGRVQRGDNDLAHRAGCFGLAVAGSLL